MDKEINMNTTTLDLWPAIDVTRVRARSPYTILREQASILSEKTLGIVQARVFQLEWEAAKRRSEGSGLVGYQDSFAYSFDLVAPAMNDYTYQLLVVSFTADFYPCTLIPHREIFPDSVGDINIADENHLLENLREIFSAPKTQKVIEAIIAQSKE